MSNPIPKAKPVPPDFPQGLLTQPARAIATHKYSARDVLELNLTRNLVLRILERKGDWWFIARTLKGDEGWVPSSYIKLLEDPSNLNISDIFATWYAEGEEALRAPNKGEKKEKLTKGTFPYIPPELLRCDEPSCKIRKLDGPLGACVHDVEVLLKGSPDYRAGWLWRETLKWHPDRFTRRLKENFKEEGLKAVSEMFSIVKELADREREKEKKAKEGG